MHYKFASRKPGIIFVSFFINFKPKNIFMIIVFIHYYQFQFQISVQPQFFIYLIFHYTLSKTFLCLRFQFIVKTSRLICSIDNVYIEHTC